MKIDLKKYNFKLPENLIAKKPVAPRDKARLFVYDRKTGQISYDTFKNIRKYLPENSTLVFNDTKVLPVRLRAKKTTGGMFELFLCINEPTKNGLIRAITNRPLNTKTIISVGKYQFRVEDKKDETYLMRPVFPFSKLVKLLEEHGTTPIPPYLKTTKLKESRLRKEYQSVLAKNPASVAAPTASLHFTNSLINELEHSGRKKVMITLHVGRGTFGPITQENIKSKTLHKEYYNINSRAVEQIRASLAKKRKIVAVGTTALRALESGSSSGKLKVGGGETSLFILPGHKFKTVNSLITNFHLPESSLMLLVEAFLQAGKAKHTVKELYDIAIKNKFRFYSFGDGMLIL